MALRYATVNFRNFYVKCGCWWPHEFQLANTDQLIFNHLQINVNLNFKTTVFRKLCSAINKPKSFSVVTGIQTALMYYIHLMYSWRKLETKETLSINNYAKTGAMHTFYFKNVVFRFVCQLKREGRGSIKSKEYFILSPDRSWKRPAELECHLKKKLCGTVCFSVSTPRQNQELGS